MIVCLLMSLTILLEKIQVIAQKFCSVTAQRLCMAAQELREALGSNIRRLEALLLPHHASGPAHVPSSRQDVAPVPASRQDVAAPSGAVDSVSLPAHVDVRCMAPVSASRQDVETPPGGPEDDVPLPAYESPAAWRDPVRCTVGSSTCSLGIFCRIADR